MGHTNQSWKLSEMIRKQQANDEHINSSFHPFTCSCLLSINKQKDANEECWVLSSKYFGFSITRAVSCSIHPELTRDFCSFILEQDVEVQVGGGAGTGSLQCTRRLGLSSTQAGD